MEQRFAMRMTDAELAELDEMRAKVGHNRTVFIRTAIKQFIAALRAGKPILLYEPPPAPKQYKPKAETTDEMYERNIKWHREQAALGRVQLIEPDGMSGKYVTKAEAVAAGGELWFDGCYHLPADPLDPVAAPTIAPERPPAKLYTYDQIVHTVGQESADKGFPPHGGRGWGGSTAREAWDMYNEHHGLPEDNRNPV